MLATGDIVASPGWASGSEIGTSDEPTGGKGILWPYIVIVGAPGVSASCCDSLELDREFPALSLSSLLKMAGALVVR
jgi:hypothetical protein